MAAAKTPGGRFCLDRLKRRHRRAKNRRPGAGGQETRAIVDTRTGASESGRPVARGQLRTYTVFMARSPRGLCIVVSIVRTRPSGESVQMDCRDMVRSPCSPFFTCV